VSRAVSVAARTIASIPARTAIDTWNVIVDLIDPHDRSNTRRELTAIAGVACSLITDETLMDDALVVYGSGPRTRIYTVHGDDAVAGDGVREDALSFDPTGGDWRISVPCLPEDLPWVQRSLARASSRVQARALGEAVSGEQDEDDRKAAGSSRPSSSILEVDLDAFLSR